MRLLDRILHGPVVFTVASSSGWTKVHRDGTEVRFRPKPRKPLRPCVRCQLAVNKRAGQLCWRCTGEDRMTSQHLAYSDDVSLRYPAQASWPHCDGNVLHARGECWACDLPEYDRLHVLRRLYAIAYTDHKPVAPEVCCPSELYRPASKINRWPGNRASR